jgi:hypothetical protein
MLVSNLTMKLKIITFLIIIPFIAAFADGGSDPSAKRFTVSGHVKDSVTGEDLFGASILIVENGTGTVANEYGFYSISLPAGLYSFRFSYTGFESQVHKIQVDKDIVLDIHLDPVSESLREVEIKAERSDANIKAPEMSIVKMDVKTINKIPALMGEVDIIKALQLLPGVQAVSEGSSVSGVAALIRISSCWMKLRFIIHRIFSVSFRFLTMMPLKMSNYTKAICRRSMEEGLHQCSM